MEEKNFGHLGLTFQQQLVKAIIEEKKYGETIIEVLESKFFDNMSFRYIIENIKELYKDFNTIPSYDTLEQKIMIENTINKDSGKIHIDTLKVVKEIEGNLEFVKKTALNFCKQQNLKKVIKQAIEISDKGEFDMYDTIAPMIQKAIEIGVDKHFTENIFDNIELTLRKDFRHPIATGIKGIDDLLKGGLGRGELGVVLAPTGTGKSTILTKFANTAYNLDFNVLHIFFEDNLNVIKKKHYTIWSGFSPDDQVLDENKQSVIDSIRANQTNSKGRLELLKLPSDDVTISKLKSSIRKMIADGFKPDIILIDYVDCISPEKSSHTDEEWKNDGPIMRSLEAMTNEFDVAIWTATQGNRESLSAEIVTIDQMGGSIKKAQIGHVIISIAKTLEQKEHNLATVTINKSRVGPDGIVFSNCKFNNEYIEINTDTQTTLLGVKEDKIVEDRERAQRAYQRVKNLNR